MQIKEGGLSIHSVCKMGAKGSRFGAKEEAQWQIKRWKANELVKSRQYLSDEMKEKPWIPYFYRAVLTSGTSRSISDMLDVGCGTGFFTRLFGRELIPNHQVLRVIGVDLNRKLLQVARQEEARHSADTRKIEYIQGDVYHLPFRSNAFSLTTSRTLLMHLSSPLKALREVKRVCKRSGRVVSIEPDYGMFGLHEPNDIDFEKEDAIVLRAQIRGRMRLYGQDLAIGRRLPDLYHKAGLKQISMDGAFEGVSVPCDHRTKASTLKREYGLQLKSLSDQHHTKEYTNVLIAGGLSKKRVQAYLRRYKVRLLREIKLLGSRESKDRMTTFFAIPFFVAIAKK